MLTNDSIQQLMLVVPIDNFSYLLNLSPIFFHSITVFFSSQSARGYTSLLCYTSCTLCFGCWFWITSWASTMLLFIFFQRITIDSSHTACIHRSSLHTFARDLSSDSFPTACCSALCANAKLFKVMKWGAMTRLDPYSASLREEQKAILNGLLGKITMFGNPFDLFLRSVSDGKGE